MTSPKMTFCDGVKKTTISEQMIAFYIHTIDMYASLAERGHSKVPTCAMGDHYGDEYHDHLVLEPTTLKVTGTNTSQSFLGAAREGLKHLLKSLPEDVKEHVVAYATKRCENIEDLKYDVILGSENPYDGDNLKCFDF